MTETDFLARLKDSFPAVIPHSMAIGMVAESVTRESAVARLPFLPQFLGDPERGLIHTAIITTLIDSTCGLALFGRLGAPESIATLDLRVDYLRASRPPDDLHCRAECYRLTDQIAFLRATVWQHDEAEPVAASTATFMRTDIARAVVL